MQRLTRVGVVSLAKVMGLSGVLIGLLVGGIYGLMLIAFGALGGAAVEEGGAGLALVGIGGGLTVMIMAPLLYGAMSFIGGLIYGLIINLVLHLAGGLELQIEMK